MTALTAVRRPDGIPWGSGTLGSLHAALQQPPSRRKVAWGQGWPSLFAVHQVLFSQLLGNGMPLVGGTRGTFQGKPRACARQEACPLWAGQSADTVSPHSSHSSLCSRVKECENCFASSSSLFVFIFYGVLHCVVLNGSC